MIANQQDVELMRLAKELETETAKGQMTSEERAERVAKVYLALLKAIWEGRKAE